jgi:hypothetical protein
VGRHKWDHIKGTDTHMQVGRYIDGRELTYDQATGGFAVGGTPVTLEQVLEYDAAGQIQWPSAEMRTWAYQLPRGVSPITKAWVAPHARVGPIAAMSPSAAVAPPAWHPDPTGRHQLRYWDGRTWSEHVSDGGIAGTDPLAQA